MAKETYLFLLVVGQLALVVLDIVERARSPRRGESPGLLRPASISFLVGVIVVYAGLQFGGVALAPSLEELVGLSQRAVGALLSNADHGQGIGWAVAVLTGVGGFYLAGLCDYLFHRFASHSRPLWFTHENHHLTTDVSAFMPGLCVRPFAVVAVLPTAAVAIFVVQLILGLAGHNAWAMMPMLYAVALAQATILGMTHSACLRRCEWLRRLLRPLGITTAQEHWLHHVSDLDCNYGNFVIVWDRVFGTYVDPRAIDIRKHRAGLGYDQDFLGTLTFGRIKLSESLRRRYQLGRFCHLAPSGDLGER